jgi:hypothetical protein
VLDNKVVVGVRRVPRRCQSAGRELSAHVSNIVITYTTSHARLSIEQHCIFIYNFS